MASAVLNTEPTLKALLKLSRMNRGIPLEEWMEGEYNDVMKLRTCVIISVFFFLVSYYALPVRISYIYAVTLSVCTIVTGTFSSRRSPATILMLLSAPLWGMALSSNASLPEKAAFAGGIWHGRVSSVTSTGVMLDTEAGRFWASSRSLSRESAISDSVIALGCRSGRFIEVYSFTVRPSTSPVMRMRELLCSRWQKRIRSREALSAVLALLVGDRSRITPGFRNVFRRSGTSHLLAVSGLHVGLVAALLYMILRRAAGRTTRVALLVAACLVLFTVITGSRASTVRAALMAGAVMFLSLRYGSRVDFLSIWCVAALIMIAAVPGIMEDRGAQLSFGAVLALILFARRFPGRRGIILTPLHAGIVVTLTMAPLVSSIFGGICPQAPVATTLSLPFMLVTMLLGVVSLLPVVSVGAAVLLEWNVWLWLGLLKLFCFEPLQTDGFLWTTLWVLLLVVLWTMKWRKGFLRRFR